MARPARVDAASTHAVAQTHSLTGCNFTPRIVGVEADSSGRARLWRRLGARVELIEDRFPNWFLLTSLDLLAHLPARRLSADWLRAAHGQVRLDEPLAIVELDGASEDDDAYRYLVLTTNLREVETALLETASKRDGEEAQSLADLRGLVLTWDPAEQYLALTGKTLFRDMQFEDLLRLQFDLETTGLDEERDRIFMISMRDSSGWQECLDTSTLSEADLLRRFVDIIQARDPDTLENHNIFSFDLSFLVRRAARLGVRLGLGRDSSEPWLETDVFDSGERPEPFLRWRVAGRQVIDTQHAVRRFGLAAPDMRRHGLKDAARYFGFARSDREYVPGPEIWSTFRTDPLRVRRYAAHDVDEVDGLARRLLPPLFELSRWLPRAYERVAADTGAASLWELLLVRAYLHEGRAIPAPAPRVQHAPQSARPELFVSGVVGPAVRMSVQPLLPSVLVNEAITAANDVLGLMPRIVGELLAQDGAAARPLAAAAAAYLASPGLFCDPPAANAISGIAREYVDRLLADVRARGGTVVEVDGEHVTFAVPSGWDDAAAQALAASAREYLPAGVEPSFGRCSEVLYARGAGTSITLGADGAITLVGPAFRAGRLERFGEAFLHRAAPCVLRGDAAALRGVFLETVHLLRSGGVPLEELSVQVTLHKSPNQYRRGGTHEEPYEVLLAAGVRSWRVGQRIRYFRARGGEPRLLREGDELSAADADTEYYVQRLCGLYCQQFAQAFGREDFARIFRVPAGPGPYVEDLQALAAIRTIQTPLA